MRATQALVLAGVTMFGLAAVTGSPALAQEEIVINGRTVTYKDWLFGPPNPGIYYPWKWNDDRRQDAEWVAENERWWAFNAGIGGLDHPTLWHFIMIGDGNPAEPFDLRFVSECIAAGDIVIPFWSGVDPGTYVDPTPPRRAARLVFAVFAPGTPPEAAERITRNEMRWTFRIPEDEIDRALATFRASLPAAPP